MNLELIRASVEDAKHLWEMQVEAFMESYNKYHDIETNPATEPIDKIIMRLEQPFTYYYYIQVDNDIVGAVRIVDKKEDGKAKRISPIFVMPYYQNRGIAQKAILEVEKIHGASHWELDTILQEEGNCHLYEKMGYYQTGQTKAINNKMTLVRYIK